MVLSSLLKAELALKMKSIKPIVFLLSFKVKQLHYSYYMLLLLLTLKNTVVKIPTKVLLYMHQRKSEQYRHWHLLLPVDLVHTSDLYLQVDPSEQITPFFLQAPFTSLVVSILIVKAQLL